MSLSITRHSLCVLLPVSFFLLGCASQTAEHASHSPVQDREELRPDSPIEAAMFRYNQRLSADGTVPENALLKALAHREAMIAAGATAPIGAGDGPSWDWLGPGNIGGRVREVLVHPNDSDIMWTGGASGGVWKTTNAGGSWQPLNNYMATLSIGCMAMDPLDPDVIYVGTGEGFFNTVEGTSNLAAVKGAGIFRSTNGGAIWKHLNSTSGSDWDFVNRIAIGPGNPNLILAATAAGIFRSVDGGNSWSKRSDKNVVDIRFDPNNPANMVAGCRDFNPLYSTNTGLDWDFAPGISGLREEVRYAPSSPGTVYAAVSQNSNRIKIYKSTDGGQTYTLATAGSGISAWSGYNNVLWVDPTNENNLLLGGVWMWRSTDGGVTFTQAFSGDIHADMHSITSHPDYDGVDNKTIYVGCDGGVYRVDDAYVNDATELNNNLGITQFYGGAVAPDGIVIGGTQDNGTLRYSGGTENWTSEIGGDGGFCAADPTDPNYMYGETQRLLIRRSTNAGLTFTQVTTGLTDIGGQFTNFIPYFTLDPNDSNRMLAAARRLWRCDNMKDLTPTWSSIKPAIESAGPPTGGDHFSADDPRNISTITVAEGNSNVIWVGYNNGQVYKTDNGTAISPDWTRLDGNGLFPLPDRWISTIAINPANHNVAYVALMGWESDNLWKTVDGGQTWGDISGQGVLELAPAPASALAVDWSIPGRIFVGTDIGVFTSNTDGVKWTVHTQGPGTVPVEQLLWKDSETLVAVTHGRGMFEADISKPLFMDQITLPPDPTPPNVDPLIGVEVTPGRENPVLGSVVTMVRGRAGFNPVPMRNVGGDRYELVMPTTECGPAVDFYIEAVGDGGSVVRMPEGAPASFFTYRIGRLNSIFHDNFETTTGWAVENLGATAGDWQRGVPVNDPGWAYDPAFDSDGSGQCFLTQNELGNTDVDEGAVALTSPNLDMSGGEVSLSYDYYLYLTEPGTLDQLSVEVSSSGVGGPWTQVVQHNSDGGLLWRSHTLTNADFNAVSVPLTSTMRIRFVANDADPQSIVEAGIDAFDLSVLTCSACYADCDQSTGVGVLDVFDFLCFQNSFVAGNLYACDCDLSTGPGVCDIFDFLCFQSAFVQGCP